MQHLSIADCLEDKKEDYQSYFVLIVMWAGDFWIRFRFLHVFFCNIIILQHWYCSRTGCIVMGMCCEKMMIIGWRNAWSMKLRVQDQGEDQRGPGKIVLWEDCQARKLNKTDAVVHCKWRKVIKEVRWPGWVWASECFFWYGPTRVVPDKRPLNGCCCCCCF